MKKFFATIFFVLVAFIALAQQAQNFSIDKIISTPPNPPKLVNDYTSTLTQDQQQALEYKLVQLDVEDYTDKGLILQKHINGTDCFYTTEEGRFRANKLSVYTSSNYWDLQEFIKIKNNITKYNL